MPSRHHAATPAPRRATTTRRRPRPAPRRRISRLLAWLLAAWLGNAGWAMAQLAPVAPNALPTGGQVRVGTGTLTQTGNLLLIQLEQGSHLATPGGDKIDAGGFVPHNVITTEDFH